MKSKKNWAITEPNVPSKQKARPSIGYAYLDDSVRAFDQLEHEFLIGMIKQFRVFCSLHWDEVAIAGGIGWDRVPESSMRRNFRIPPSVGRKELYHIKIGRKPRVWGYRDGDVFQVIWFDPHHEVMAG